jgi:hypothetical protein
MSAIPETAERLKERYCRNDGVNCARLMVRDALGADKVPVDLYPMQKAKAKDLLS